MMKGDAFDDKEIKPNHELSEVFKSGSKEYKSCSKEYKSENTSSDYIKNEVYKGGSSKELNTPRMGKVLFQIREDKEYIDTNTLNVQPPRINKQNMETCEDLDDPFRRRLTFCMTSPRANNLGSL